MNKTIRPLGSQVVAKQQLPQTKTKSGLYLPKTATEKSTVVEVIAIGPDVKAVKIGDKIIFKQYESTDIKLNNQNYLIIKEEAILAIIQGEK